VTASVDEADLPEVAPEFAVILELLPADPAVGLAIGLCHALG